MDEAVAQNIAPVTQILMFQNFQLFEKIEDESVVHSLLNSNFAEPKSPIV